MNRIVGVLACTTMLLATTTVARPASRLDSGSAAAIATRGFEAFSPVGLSVAVVSDGALIFSDGYGVREIGEAGEIDADTLLPIASLTKAFTAVALAVLVDEGTISWEDRVIDHLPRFRMWDPWVTREFTIRDLLSHRSGLPEGAGDLLFWPDGKATRSEVVRALRYLEPETSFRTEYAYDNLLYIVAGELIGEVSGTPWEDFVETRIFKPLDMGDCRALAVRTAQVNNRATQHGRVDGIGAASPMANDPDEPTSSAGSIWCSANSMAKWARLFLDDGVASDGKRVISEERVQELLGPVTITRTRGYMRTMGRTHFSAYALGWFVSDFHGHLLASHSGAGIGTTSYIALLPELDAAVVALSNDYSSVTSSLTMQLADSLVREEPHDWIKTFAGAEARMREIAAEEGDEAADEESLDLELPLEAFVGSYRDPWYGDVVVSLKDSTLTIDMTRSKALTGELIRRGGHRFVARWSDRTLNADAHVVFATTAEGTVSAMKMSAASPSTDFSFDFHDLKLVRVDSD